MATGAVFEPQATADPEAVVDPRSPLSALATRPAVAVERACPLSEVVQVMQAASVSAVSIRDLLAVLLQAVDSHLWLTSLRVAIDPPTEIWIG